MPARQAQEVPGPATAARSALDEYRTLLTGIARQALASPRLAAPLPCLPHWMAGNDHIVVAVSVPGALAGLQPGDRLQRIAGTALNGSGGGVWDAVLRSLPSTIASYDVESVRGGIAHRVTLPCSRTRAVRLHAAERAMWAAVTRHDWDACIERGQEMLDTFGSRASPPLMMMTRCVAAAGGHDRALTVTLAETLLEEYAAHPSPSPDAREQIRMTVRELDAAPGAGGSDSADELRRRMIDLGIATPPAPQPRDP